MRIIILAGLILAGCATGSYDGYEYRSPCAAGKKMTRGNCGVARVPETGGGETSQGPKSLFGTPEGAGCNSDVDCQYGQLCRKGNGWINPGVCVNRN